MKRPSNPFAFPGELRMGMTLRDWFAGQALPAIVADYFADPANRGPGDTPVKAISEVAYLYADAMLAEREREP